jgi:hypothetical protein
VTVRRTVALCLAALALAAPHATAAPRIDRVSATPALHEVVQAAASKDGRYVAVAAYPSAPVEVLGLWGPYPYNAPAVGPLFMPPIEQVYLVDRLKKTATLVSAGPGNAPADKDASNPSISADGRYVTFQSYATNLVKRPAAPTWMSGYVYDRVTKKLSLVTRDWHGDEIKGSDVRITPDGSTFLLMSSQRVARDDVSATGATALYARDRKTGRTWAVTRAKDGKVGRAYVWAGVQPSRTGRYVVSASGQLFNGSYGPESTAASGNVYLFDTKTGSGRLLRGKLADSAACPQSGDDMNVCGYDVTAVAVDPEGTRVAYAVSTDGDYRLVVVDVKSGASSVVASFPTGPPDRLAFSVDGKALYVVGPPAGADSATGTRVLYRNAIGTHTLVALSTLPKPAGCRTDGCLTYRIGTLSPVAGGIVFTTDAPLTDDDTDGLMDAYAVTG